MARLPPSANHLARDERGAAILEMAAVVPVLLLIGLGVFEFGNLYYSRHLVSNGVRDGARYAAGFQAEDVCDSGSTIQDNIKRIAMTGTLSESFADADKRVVFWDQLSETEITCSETANDSLEDYRGGEIIYTVTVKAVVPYQALGFLGYLNIDSIVLESWHEERIYNVR